MNEEAAQILMARQPIIDTSYRIQGYELLFRDAHLSPTDISGDKSTSRLIDRLLTTFTLEEITDNSRAFINFTRFWLLNPPSLSPDNTVIEILETVPLDDAVLASIADLKKQGFTLALDDVIDTERLSPLLKLVDIVKVDVLHLSPNEIEQIIQQLKPYDITLLAEKIEDHEVFHFCKSLGFSLFQGFFFSKPQLLSGKELNASALAVMNLIAQLQDPNCKIDDIEQIIKQDPTLSIKLLKWVNSPLYRRRKEIESIKQAILQLGLDRVRNFVTLLSLSDLQEKPSILCQMALTRASMCEWLAKHHLNVPSASYFLGGLLSLIDAFFDQPKADVLEKLPIDTKLKSAILNYEGLLGQTILAVSYYQQALWDYIQMSTLDSIQASLADLNQAYVNAIQETNQWLHVASRP